MAAAADRIVASMESLVPQDQGDLLASIGWVFGNNIPAGAIAFGRVSNADPDLVITIFAGSLDTMVDIEGRVGVIQNAFLQEFGTVNSPPSPFFFTSVRLNRNASRRRIRQGVREGLRIGSR